MKMFDPTFLLRVAIAIILLMHSIPSIFSNGVYEFGANYLNQVGFSPIGIPIAWAIKLSHVVCAVLLLLNKYIKPAAMVTIVILVAGIIMIHYKEGWFVVGGGRNGMEFNFLMIVALWTIMYPHSTRQKHRK